MIHFFNQRHDCDKKYSVADFSCAICNNIFTQRVQNLRDKKYPYCNSCYQKSNERKNVSKKIILARESFSGENNPNYKGGLIKKECSCGNTFSVYPARRDTAKYCSTKCKKKYSISKCKIFEYKGYRLRSSWELSLAQYFNEKSYSWKYEPEAFKTSVGFYTPDFWVSELNCYFEVKGYFRDENAKIKFEEFSKKNSVILADLVYFKSLGFERVKSGINKGQLWQPAVQP